MNQSLQIGVNCLHSAPPAALDSVDRSLRLLSNRNELDRCFVINKGLNFRPKPRESHLLPQLCSQDFYLNTPFMLGFFLFL